MSSTIDSTKRSNETEPLFVAYIVCRNQKPSNSPSKYMNPSPPNKSEGQEALTPTWEQRPHPNDLLLPCEGCIVAK